MFFQVVLSGLNKKEARKQNYEQINEYKDSLTLQVSHSQIRHTDVAIRACLLLLRATSAGGVRKLQTLMQLIQDLVNNSEDVLFCFKMCLYFWIHIWVGFFQHYT